MSESVMGAKGNVSGGEAGANTAAIDDGRQLFGMAARGDDAGDACVNGGLHGAEFREHAAGAKRRLFLLGVMNHGVNVWHDGDGAVLWALHIAQEARGAGEEDQKVCAPKGGDSGRKRIIVADAKFIDSDGIVLIDDGNDLGEVEDALKGGFDTGGAFSALQIGVGKEELRDVQFVVPEQGLVCMHEIRLPDRRAGLEGGNVRASGALAEPEGLQARSDRSAADDDDRMTCLFEQCDGLNKLAQLHGIRLWGMGLGENA